MKKLIISIIIFFLLTGCWNYKELNEYCIVTGIAIDKNQETGDYIVSLLISNSTQKSTDANSTELQTVLYSGEGESIYEAIKDIGLIAPKELFLGHCTVLILSEDIAKDGIDNIIDFFLRFPSVRKDFQIVLARDCMAKDTLKITTPLSSYPSQSISENLLSTYELQGTVYSLDFNNMLNILLVDGNNLSINSIKIIGNEEKGSTKDNFESSEPAAKLKIDTLGIFKDDKFLAWSTMEESRGINIINNKIKELYINIPYKEGYIILRTQDMKTNIEIDLKNNKPSVDINVKSQSFISEVNTNIDLTKMGIMDEIEKKAKNEVENMINSAISLAQEYNTDIFGFGEMFHKKYPNYFEKNKKNWNKETFDRLNIGIKIDLTIQSKGTAKINIKEKEYE